MHDIIKHDDTITSALKRRRRVSQTPSIDEALITPHIVNDTTQTHTLSFTILFTDFEPLFEHTCIGFFPNITIYN